ncbi:hypothetical protein Thimo_3215 [Thioflavicoccus mobilis 8321]|uniref:Uncharacterized protein n=1 Tax=Thioflavicoccus mobilis 8321 TaxID=765912 RepID=L0H2S9_9GAMM|nr:hypothetical protein Thimo_3215 [Thioflavicoccus mobilis 8321]
MAGVVSKARPMACNAATSIAQRLQSLGTPQGGWPDLGGIVRLWPISAEAVCGRPESETLTVPEPVRFDKIPARMDFADTFA